MQALLAKKKFGPLIFGHFKLISDKNLGHFTETFHQENANLTERTCVNDSFTTPLSVSRYNDEKITNSVKQLHDLEL